MPDLPDWAELQTEREDGTELPRPVVHVDANAMYPALLGEYRDHYDAEGTDDALGADELDPEEPTRYALEVAYQSMKLDLQMALRSFNFEIRVHDADKSWAQANFPDGRPLEKRPAGVPEDEAPLPGRSTTREGRVHYKNLRGFLPA